MDNHIEPRLRPRRIPPTFSIPQELARSHGVSGSDTLSCEEMVYTEGYGMIPCRAPYPDPEGTPKDRILLYVEDVLRRFIEAVSQDPPQPMTISIIRKRRGKEYWLNNQTHSLETGIKTSAMVYNAPNHTRKILCQFARLMRLTSQIITAVRSRTTVTKRELFYTDPTLFETQRVVDRMLDDIALTCHVQLEDLYVTAEEKTVMIGPHTASFLDGQYLRSGMVRWVLVVEKETVFQHLQQRAFAEQSAQGFGIILTGKGYPDRATHLHLKKILADLNALVFGLFDCDPDGFQIAKTYMFPSAFHPFCSQMIRLVKPLQFVTDVAAAGNESSLMPLTGIRKQRAKQTETQLESEASNSGGDRKKIRDILASLHHEQSQMVRDLRRDLQTLQMIGKKGEIEALGDGAGGLVRWLDAEMGTYINLSRY